MTTSHQSVRTWIWVSLVLQGLGYLYDAIWHGLLHAGAAPQTSTEMARHLATVHLPLYIGAAAVVISTARALVLRIERSTAGVALPLAFAGALVSAGAEVWHASSHLRLDTHSGPVAGTLSFVGFLIVLLAMSLSSLTRRRHRATNDARRAA